MNQNADMQLPLENAAGESAASPPQPRSGPQQNGTAVKAAGQKKNGRPMLQLAGMVVGKLTVIKFYDLGKRGKDSRWMCRCSCGKEFVATAGLLTKPSSQPEFVKSCGCSRTRWMRHGHVAGGKWSSEYTSWAAMIARCTKPRNNRFKFYGARGIKICDRWTNFKNFLTDMGLKPTPQHQIDRIDNDKNYEKSNCKWSTRREQMNNRSISRKITFQGQTKTLAEWSRFHGINSVTIANRLNSGMNMNDVFSTRNFNCTQSGKLITIADPDAPTIPISL